MAHLFHKLDHFVLCVATHTTSVTNDEENTWKEQEPRAEKDSSRPDLAEVCEELAVRDHVHHLLVVLVSVLLGLCARTGAVASANAGPTGKQQIPSRACETARDPVAVFCFLRVFAGWKKKGQTIGYDGNADKTATRA